MAEPAEIPEHEADGEIAALYDDIKTATGVGMVNLIYRRMATVPGQLAWAWGTVRPLFADGDIGRARTAMVAALDLPPVLPISRPALAVVGVDGAGEASIGQIIDAYNRGNSGNLFALSALATFLDSGAEAPAEPGSAAPAPARPPDLPPIVALAEMDWALADLVRDMSAPVAPPGRPMIPSLYRHLALWPGFLALAATTMLPHQQGGAVARLAGALHRQAVAEAPALAARLRTPAATTPPSGAAREELIATFRAYGQGPIATMIVIGHMLRRALP